MIDFNDPENVANNKISIDDAAAVTSMIVIELFGALVPPGEVGSRLTDFSSRMLDIARDVTMTERKAFFTCLAHYLVATEPGA